MSKKPLAFNEGVGGSEDTRSGRLTLTLTVRCECNCANLKFLTKKKKKQIV